MVISTVLMCFPIKSRHYMFSKYGKSIIGHKKNGYYSESGLCWKRNKACKLSF